ncbi:MAG: DUF6142 family protein [Lachnospiraceae bacterium]|nr:DUF6142 family protein [Lachnospiraceae bacterium]
MLNGKKSYNFSDKTHSRDGRLATVLGAGAWLLFGFLVVESILTKGSLGIWFGLLGMVDVIIALAGLVIALMSFREEDSLKLFPRLGTLLNGMVLLILIALFIIGL